MSLFDAIDHTIANWVSPTKECNDLGLPAVYVRASEVVWQFPDGDIVSDEVGGQRVLAMLNADTNSEGLLASLPTVG